MALENISNMPEVLLRIAPRALHIPNFLPNPPPYLPPRHRRGVCDTLSHRTPPGKKSWIRPCMPLVVGVNENCDEDTTQAQIIRPDWDFSPLRMRTMHHCPHIFFDTLRPERPDCPVLIPSNFSVARDKLISQDIYSYESCGLPTGNFIPQERAQIRLMTASPVTLRACIPAPDQVTPEQAYFRDRNFYKQTLFHTPFLSRGRAVTLLEYRDAQIIFEVDAWFHTLPGAVQRYLLPLKTKYIKWYNENVRNLTQNYAFCDLCKGKTSNLQRHHMQHHARWRSIWFCPIPGCPTSTSNKEGLVRHLQSKQHAKGLGVFRGRILSKQIVNQNCFWPPIARIKEDHSLCRALLDGWCSHGEPVVPHRAKCKRHALHRCLRGLLST